MNSGAAGRSAVRRLFGAVALASLLAVTIGGCGLRTAVRPPEDTAPVVPGDVTAIRDKGEVTVKWKRADRSADGMRVDDLAAFVVEKKNGDGDSWRKVATVDVVDQEKLRRKREFSWRDREPGDGLPSYRVSAVCADGQQGSPVETTVPAAAVSR